MPTYPVPNQIVGPTGNVASVTDHLSLQVTPPPEGKTAFGEMLTAQITPIIGLSFPYNVNAAQITAQDNQSGSSSISTSMLALSTGAAANSSSRFLTNQSILYEPGQGVRVRFTAMFTTGVANSAQMMGIGDSGQGLFFGYNGTAFGIMRRYGGNPEVRTLTVTTKSSHVENITITLDGDADATVAVTNGADTTVTANEIAANDYSDVGRGWTAKAVGSKVVFTSWNSVARSGTFSLSAATSAVGTFARTLAGVAPTDTWVAQASWNGPDIFDGNGVTGVTLDPTKLNVYQIDFQYLGAGLIRFFIEDPNDGELHLVHSIEYANANTRPSLDNPTMPLTAIVENVSNTTNLTLKTASIGGFIDGIRINNGVKRGYGASRTLGATAAETPICSLRIKEVYQSKLNRSKIKINYISTSVEHTKPCAINFYANPTLVAASFSDLATATSAIEVDTSATSFSGGTLLFTFYLGKTGNGLINLSEDLTAAEFGAGNVITATLAPTSGNAAEGNVSFNFTEKL